MACEGVDKYPSRSVRKTLTRSRFEAAESGKSPLSCTNGDVEGAVIAKASVWLALDVLSPRRRAIVVMRELQGIAIPAIASLLGISQVTVRWHLSMGRRDLITALRAHTEE